MILQREVVAWERVEGRELKRTAIMFEADAASANDWLVNTQWPCGCMGGGQAEGWHRRGLIPREEGLCCRAGLGAICVLYLLLALNIIRGI